MTLDTKNKSVLNAFYGGQHKLYFPASSKFLLSTWKEYN